MGNDPKIVLSMVIPFLLVLSGIQLTQSDMKDLSVGPDTDNGMVVDDNRPWRGDEYVYGMPLYHAPLTGNTLYVGGGGAGNYSTIQDALDDSSDGDMIIVYDGTYSESLTVDTMVEIRGIDHPVLDPGCCTGITINADNVTIRGMNISIAFTGIEVAGSGAEIISNIFYHNSDQDILISKGAPALLTSFVDHGSTIADNRFERSVGGSSIYVQYSFSFDPNVDLDCMIGRFDITGNTFLLNGTNANAINMDSGFSVAGLNGGTYDLGGLNASNNTIWGGQMGINYYSAVFDLADISGDMGEVIIRHNRFREMTGTSIMVSHHIIDTISGDSNIEIGRLDIRWNDIRSSHSSTGIHISNFGMIMRLSDTSNITHLGMMVSNNLVDVKGYGILIFHQLTGYLLSDGSSVRMGNLLLIGNDIKASEKGLDINHLQIGYGLRNHSSCSVGDIRYEGNRIEARIGLFLSTLALFGMDLKDRGSVSIGHISASRNNITAVEIGFRLGSFTSMGKRMMDNTTFTMKGVDLNHNIIRAIDNTGMDIGSINQLGIENSNDSYCDIGPISIVRNNVDCVDGYGIVLDDMSNFAINIMDRSVVRFAGFMMSHNYVCSNKETIRTGSIGYMGIGLIASSEFHIGDIRIESNRVESNETGINLGPVNYFGYSSGYESLMEMGSFVVSHNEVTTKDNGLAISTIGYMGISLYGASFFRMKDILIENNSMEGPPDKYGISMAYTGYIGYDLEGASSVVIGDISISENDIQGFQYGLLQSGLGQIGSGLSSSTKVRIGDIRVDHNTISSEKEGIRMMNPSQLAFSLTDRSSSEIGNISVSENMIDALGAGANISFSHIAGGLSGLASASIGSFRFTGNEISADGDGLNISISHIGFFNAGTSTSRVGDILIEDNEVSCLHGIRLWMENIESHDQAELRLGEVRISDNTVEGSEIFGIEVSRQIKTYEFSSIVTGVLRITDNRVHDCGLRGILLRNSISRSPDSLLKVGIAELTGNNITGCGVGLHLIDMEDNLVYLNNFIDNIRDVITMGSSSDWNSTEEIEYKYEMWNYTGRLGNYWDEYSGSDGDGDGIGDTSHPVGTEEDEYPLMIHQENYLPPIKDETPPEVEITGPANGSYLSEVDVTVTWEMEDDLIGLKGCEISLDGGTRTDMGFGTSHELFNLSEGIHTVTVFAADHAGNENSSTVHFTVDISVPEIDIIHPPSDSGINNSTVNITWTAVDDVSGIEHFDLRTDGGSWVDIGTDTYHIVSLETEGEHSISVRAVDRAGNSENDSVAFILDTYRPEFTSITPPDGSYINSRALNISWSASDNGSGILGYHISTDGINWTDPGSQPEYMVNVSEDGPFLFRLRAFDMAGNTRTEEITITVDTLDPTVELTYPQQGHGVNTVNPTITWTGNGTGSPMDGYELKMDGGEWIMVGQEEQRTFTGLSEGDHTLMIKALDMAGNVFEGTFVFKVDTDPPDVISHSPDGEEVPVNTWIEVVFSEEMDRNSVSISLGSVSGTLQWEDDKAIFKPDEALETSTEYEVTVTGSDLSGNSMENYTWSFTTLETEEAFGTIKGRVLDGNGEPIEGAKVELQTGQETTTGPDGRFTLMGPEGKHTLIISKDGFKTEKIEVEIEANSETEIDDLEMEKDEDDKGINILLILLFFFLILVLVIIIILVAFVSKRRKGEGEDWEE